MRRTSTMHLIVQNLLYAALKQRYTWPVSSILNGKDVFITSRIISGKSLYDQALSITNPNKTVLSNCIPPQASYELCRNKCDRWLSVAVRSLNAFKLSSVFDTVVLQNIVCINTSHNFFQLSSPPEISFKITFRCYRNVWVKTVRLSLVPHCTLYSVRPASYWITVFTAQICNTCCDWSARFSSYRRKASHGTAGWSRTAWQGGVACRPSQAMRTGRWLLYYRNKVTCWL